MTLEQYYWYVRRPQILKAYQAKKAGGYQQSKTQPKPKDPAKSYFIYANGAEVEKDIEGEVTSESFDAELGGSPLKKVILGTHVTSIVGPGFEDTAIEEIEIPNTITYFGTAFTNCAHLKKIAVPEGIDHIIADTFSGCVRLATIELPSTLDSNFKPRTIAAGAFENCGSEAEQQVTLVCKATVPPVTASGILGSAFDGMPNTPDKIKIGVPIGSAQAYKDATDGWSYFNDDCFVEAITSMEQFKHFATEGYKTLTKSSRIELMTDLDMNEFPEFSGIPKFIGTFNGNGFTVKNININTIANHVGFICDTANVSEYPVVIRNLNFENVIVISTGEHIGTVVGYGGSKSATEILNCKVDGTTIKGLDNVGGIIGSGVCVTPQNCKVSNAHITSGNGQGTAGGIIGYTMEPNGSKVISGNSFSGTIVSNSSCDDKTVGGIIGFTISTAIKFQNNVVELTDIMINGVKSEDHPIYGTYETGSSTAPVMDKDNTNFWDNATSTKESVNLLNWDNVVIGTMTRKTI